MAGVIIRGAEVVVGNETQHVDVLIRDGVVAAMGTIDDPDATTLDATGCWLLPGFVDLHTHLREPGRESAETIATGTRAAVLGGYTAVVAMPNTEPTTDDVKTVQFVRDRATQTGACEVVVASAITKNRDGTELVDIEALAHAGVQLFTDDGSGVQDGSLLREAMQRAKAVGAIIAEHCEDAVIANAGVMNGGELADSLGVPGMPAEAEELMAMRDIALARETGARLHLLHVSTAKAVAMVREAKRAGIAITAEATPHHFTLTQEELQSRDPTFRVNPPLRREQDRIAVINGLRDGTIDAIATDHAPHDPALKTKPLEQAPPGMLGLETALALATAELDLTPPMLATIMSTAPAEIAGLADRQGTIGVGRPANITIVDPDAQWVVDREALASKAKNTPYDGRKVRGRVIYTFVDGNPVVVDGKVQG